MTRNNTNHGSFTTVSVVFCILFLVFGMGLLVGFVYSPIIDGGFLVEEFSGNYIFIFNGSNSTGRFSTSSPSSGSSMGAGEILSIVFGLLTLAAVGGVLLTRLFISARAAPTPPAVPVEQVPLQPLPSPVQIDQIDTFRQRFEEDAAYSVQDRLDLIYYLTSLNPEWAS